MLLFKAYSELRSMPYFGKFQLHNSPISLSFSRHSITDMRLKFLTIFMLFVLCISLVVTMNRFGFSILEDNFVASLNTTYKSSAQFMCFYGLLNFYLYSMAYVYSPSGRQVHEPTITKDNPAFSMINDSDEEVVYGSGDESRRLTGNEYDSD
jgi:Wnt-binding factor required for Wnt secretion